MEADRREAPQKRMWPQVILLIAAIYVFLVSIGLLGTAFKLFGSDLSKQLIEMTSNPMVGLVAGILATTLAQSSSSTTSIVVGMVAGGAMTIEGAIPVIMGANIGTSVTNTLVSMGHITRKEEFMRALAGASVHDFFNLIAVAILLPLELMLDIGGTGHGPLYYASEWAASLFAGVGGMTFASPLKAIVGPVVALIVDALGSHPIAALVVALVMMFSALKLLVSMTGGVVVKRSERFLHRYLFGSPLTAMAFGLVITAIVQSSSVTTSLIVPLVGAGLLTVEQIFPYTLGANVGTTVTAMLASLSTGSILAVTVAFAHLFFNVLSITILYPVPAVRRIPIIMAKALAALTSRSRFYAIGYVVVAFYALPLLLLLIWR
jgi:solute carrier family 34 (sodium-dependent phosphate cotransporter)